MKILFQEIESCGDCPWEECYGISTKYTRCTHPQMKDINKSYRTLEEVYSKIRKGCPLTEFPVTLETDSN